MKHKFITILSLIVLGVMGVCVSGVSAETYSYYTYTVSNGEVKITDCDTHTSGNITIPSKIAGYPVTSIGSYAFYDCLQITGIVIPDSVKIIEDYAFKGNGHDFQLDDEYSMLKSVSIPDSVTYIGISAFSDCIKLTDLTIPNGVEIIEDSAFYGCDSLKTIVIPESVTYIGENAFEGSTFYEPGMSDSIKRSSLESVIIKGNTSIGERAFANCRKLKTVDFQGNITAIGNSAFSGSGLESVTIPGSVEKIGDRAFADCQVLRSVTLLEGVKVIGEYAFSGTEYISDYAYPPIPQDLSELEIVNLPDSLITIGKCAFANCAKLKSISIPRGIKNIGESAFSGGKYSYAYDEHGYNYITVTYSLKTVYFNGNETDWKNINMHSNNSVLKTATKKFYAYITIMDKSGNILSEKTSDMGSLIDLSDIVIPEGCSVILYTDAKMQNIYDATAPISENLTLYIDYILQSLLKIEGNQYAMSGEKGLTQNVFFVTDKTAQYFVCTIKYPKALDLAEIKSNSFEVEYDAESIGEYNYLYLTCIYNGNIPTGISVSPFELVFNVSHNVELNDTLTIEILDDAILADNSENIYPFYNIRNSEITINAALASSITINGSAKISTPSTYTASVFPAHTTNKAVIWSVSDEAIATISQDGILTPIKNGTVIIRATAIDGSGTFAEKSVTIKMITLVTSISIIGADETSDPASYTAYVLPSDATDKNVIWSVSDETIATISQDGILTPIKKGTVIVRATAKDGSGTFAEKSVFVNLMTIATVTNISSNLGVWDQKYSSEINSYTIYVPASQSSITLTAKHSGTLKGDGKTFISSVAKTILLPTDETILNLKYSCADHIDNVYTITIKKFEGTKTTVSPNGNTFTVNPINVENGKTVILSLYNDNAFVGAQTATYNGNVLTFTTSTPYKKAKIMVWDTISKMKSICDVEIIK